MKTSVIAQYTLFRTLLDLIDFAKLIAISTAPNHKKTMTKLFRILLKGFGTLISTYICFAGSSTPLVYTLPSTRQLNGLLAKLLKLLIFLLS